MRSPTVQVYVRIWLTGLLWCAAGGLFSAGAAAQAPALSGTPLPLDDLGAFRPAAANWRVAGGVYADRTREHALEVQPGSGVLVNLPTPDQHDNLFTPWEHGDLALALDVMMPKGSNAGLYLQGRYEVQLLDSWGVRRPHFSDMGGIYERWEESRPEGRRGYEGIPPRINAARAPGLWQHLTIRFRAPRFDAAGRKIENARFERVTLNGVVIHENVEVTGPTRGAAFDDEQPAGPLIIQGDHGPIALRHIRYQRYRPERVRLTDVRYRYYRGAFEELPDLAAVTPAAEGTVDGFRHDVVGSPDTFAVAFDGTLHVPGPGLYRFALDLDWITGDPHFQGRRIGGGFVQIGGRRVVLHGGAGRTATGAVELDAGAHPVTVAYFKNRPWHAPFAVLAVEGPDTPYHVLNVPASLPMPRPVGPILVEPAQEPVVLRGMVAHGDARRTHAVSVGDPEGVHYAMDVAQGALLYVWRGPFVDATPMWEGRGETQLAQPLGSVVTLDGGPAVAVLDGRDAPWPARVPEGRYRFLGYELDASGRPNFRYRIGEVAVSDHLSPAEGGRALRRRVTLQGDGEGAGLWHRVAEGERIEQLPDGSYSVDDRSYYVAFEGPQTQPVIHSAAGRQELRVPVSLDGGEGRVAYTLIW